MNEALEFDLAPISVSVTIGGKPYVLKEASEDAARQWNNANLKAMKMSDGKLSGMDGVADNASLLISLCLFDITDGFTSPVSLATIRSWPHRITKPLFEKCKSISGLGESGDEDREKKS